MEHKDRAEAPEDELVEGVDSEVPAGDDDYAAPFEARSFGGEYVWAQAAGYTAKVLRVRAGEQVAISTKGRRDMFVMLTELVPAASVAILEGEHAYRLVAMTDVELFTIYSPK